MLIRVTLFMTYIFIENGQKYIFNYMYHQIHTFYVLLHYRMKSSLSFDPHHQKTGLGGFLPGQSQNELCSLNLKFYIVKLERLYEPRRKKNSFLHMQKQRRRSASW